MPDGVSLHGPEACTCYLGDPDDPTRDEEACAAVSGASLHEPIAVLRSARRRGARLRGAGAVNGPGFQCDGGHECRPIPACRRCATAVPPPQRSAPDAPHATSATTSAAAPAVPAEPQPTHHGRPYHP